MSINIIVVGGNVGKDPEVFHTQAGNTKLSFSLATSERWKDKSGEQMEETQWHNVVIWGNQATYFADKISKGMKVVVTGKMTYRKWQAEDGQARSMPEVAARNIEIPGLPGAGGGGGGGGYQNSNQGAPPPAPGGDEDDLPF